MEDLIPLLIFVVIAVINLLKYLAEKGGKKATAPPSEKRPPRRDMTGIEEFFEELAGRFEPQPAESSLPADERERPDVIQEVEALEDAGRIACETEDVEKIIAMPTMKTAFPVSPGAMKSPAIRNVGHKRALKAAIKSMPAMICDTRGMRISSSPFPRIHGAQGIEFSLKKKGALRKALLANLIFRPPRAYDTSFDNTFPS